MRFPSSWRRHCLFFRLSFDDNGHRAAICDRTHFAEFQQPIHVRYRRTLNLFEHVHIRERRIKDLADWVFPVPGAPRNTTLSLAVTKSSVPRWAMVSLLRSRT